MDVIWAFGLMAEQIARHRYALCNVSTPARRFARGGPTKFCLRTWGSFERMEEANVIPSGPMVNYAIREIVPVL